MMDSNGMVDVIESLIEKNLSKDIFRLGEVTATHPNGIRVKFDGETVASTKYYQYAGSANIILTGDRVLLARVKGSYVVIGKVTGNGNGYYKGFGRIYPYDGNGDGVAIGMGGTTVIGAGESAVTLMDAIGPNYGEEHMRVAADYDVLIETNLQSGAGGRFTTKFSTDGKFFPAKYKYGNGYNMIANRVNSATDDPFLIQSFTGAVTLATSATTGNTSFTFPVVFSSVPDWCIISGRDANSAHASFAVYNLTTSGGTVYATRLPSTGTASYTTNYQILVGGIRT